MRRLELTGKRFGRLLVLGFHGKVGTKLHWDVLCDCGNRFTGAAYNIQKAKAGCNDCGNKLIGTQKTVDITGQKFGRWTAVRFDHKNSDRGQFWRFKCLCGTERVVDKSIVLTGNSRSCGCLERELTTKRNWKHGLSKSPLYAVFNSMKMRCNNQNTVAFPNYGGRGIRVLWNSFDEFKEDMYESYLQHIKEFGSIDTTIDRIDNDGNYCKENCRWATRVEQVMNRRITVRS